MPFLNIPGRTAVPPVYRSRNAFTAGVTTVALGIPLCAARDNGIYETKFLNRNYTNPNMKKESLPFREVHCIE